MSSLSNMFDKPTIQLEYNKKLRGQPGIESITKQYLYQLAYQPFVEAHQIDTVRNCFLMPTSSAEIVVLVFTTFL